MISRKILLNLIKFGIEYQLICIFLTEIWTKNVKIRIKR